jgi:alpha-glucosidase
MGLSGFSFVGCDIGGFAGTPSGELYARWLQAGVFYPFMRSHSEVNSPTKEPWSFGKRCEAVNKRTIELRYELLPYIYNAMQQASKTGVPALRPLFLEFPKDDHVAGLGDEFLFGPDLLAAPVLHEGVTNQQVYLPEGEWFDYWTGRQFGGGRSIHVPVTLDSIPMFVRGGGFIFRQPAVQSTDEMPGKPLCILAAAAKESESSLYEDDGETLDYSRGNFMQRRFHQIRDDHRVTVDVSAPEGSYRPAARDLVLELWFDQQPKAVNEMVGAGSSTSDAALPRLSAGGLARSQRGWSFANGLLTIKDADPFVPMRFTVER